MSTWGHLRPGVVTHPLVELVWDDVAVGDISDCDLDISEMVDLYAAKSGLSLTVDVEMAITGYDAGNLLGAGYTITDYDTVLSTDEDYVVDESTNVNAQSYTFTCNF